MNSLSEELIELVEDIASELEGTCSVSNDLSNIIEEAGFNEDTLPISFFQAIDEKIFCCANCGWWCSSDEKEYSQYDEEICSQCKDDEENE